jgi:hypothetical protein
MCVQIANDEPQPICWEFDEPMPTWLEKVVRRQEFLTSQTDPSDRYESSLKYFFFLLFDSKVFFLCTVYNHFYLL